MNLPLRSIYPLPASLLPMDGAYLMGTETTLKISAGALSEGAQDELKVLFNRFAMTLGNLTIKETSELTGYQAMIGQPDALPMNDGDEYALNVCEAGVFINALTETGLLHALFTLLQLIEPLSKTEFALPCMLLHDRPAVATRMLHLCIFPETTLTLIEKAIRLAGMLKYTHVILEFWGMYRYRAMDALSWPEISFTAEQIKPLIQLIRSMGMEPVPMLNHLGHATQSRSVYGRHVVLDQDPTQALLFEPDGWTWCLSNPDTLNLLRAMRAELIELFGPGEYFHLGCDESYSFASCPRCREHDQAELLSSFLNGLTEELAAQGRRPIIWADQLLDATKWTGDGIDANQRPDQTTHLALPLLDKRLILADWQYNVVKTDDMRTSRYLKEQGFDVLLCPWDAKKNVDALCAATIEQQQMGFIATTWHHLPDYLKRMCWAAAMGWKGQAECRENVWLEMGALLRKLMPYPHAYKDAGFNAYEVLG